MDIHSTRKEFEELDYFKPTDEFNGVVIVPTNEMHDSGFRCMKFALTKYSEVVGCVGGGSDIVEKYCKKGTKMVVEGRIQNDNYEKDGVKHYSVAVIVENIEFAESKKGGTSEKKAEEAEFVNVSSDELPFS